MKKDTIAAIATAMVNSGIGIIRISGEEAFSIIDRIYTPKRGDKKLSEEKSHTLHYGYILDGKKIIDEVIVLIMKAPNSYTMEDTVEIDCHGGVLVMKHILEIVIKYGARPAEPGEFTKRAFLNGRIDLSQAESVIDLINAKNDFALKSSINQLQGAVTNKIKEIRGKVIHEIAFIESALDDPEHISMDGYREQLLISMENLSNEIEGLIHSSESGILLKEGIKTVIIGKPNVGKSSLLNAFVGKDRAIVTDIAGTTRDTLEEQINLNGITLNIIDTAGIHNTNDEVEKIGVEKAKEHLLNSDLILFMMDSSTEIDESDIEIMNLLLNKNFIVLLNKSDIVHIKNLEFIETELQRMGLLGKHFIPMKHIIRISVKEKTGLENLESVIKDMFFQGKISFNDEVFITNIRHKTALTETLNSFQMVKESIEGGFPEDFYSIDLMNAYEELGNIIGESLGEDLVNEIFSKFCMGK